MRWVGRGAILLALAVAPAHAGLVFQNVFDSSLASDLSPSDVTRWENAFIYAEGVLSGLFTNDATVNVTLAATSAPTVLGESETSVVGAFPYSVLQSVLPGIPAVDPTGGGNYWLTSAQAKALGASATGSDGTITFGTSFDYTFDPNLRSVVGDYDFIGVAEHELTEVMGRIGLLGVDFGYGPAYGVLDLYGYTSPGQLSLNQTSTGVYFSVDGGVTALRYFNNPGNGGDLRDWANGQGPDSFNAFAFVGQEDDISPVDLQVMQSIGWNLASVPEPGTGVLSALALGAAWLGLRKKLRAG
jgi:hypothetical protein